MTGILQAIPIYLLFLAFAYTGKVAKNTKRFDIGWSIVQIVLLYPFFYFIDGEYHSVWYLAPTGFIASYWFGKLLQKAKEEKLIIISRYWKGYFLGAFLIIVLATGVHFFSRSGNSDYSLLCSTLFLFAFFAGIFGSIVSPKYEKAHMENTHLMTPYKVIDQQPAKPLLRGFSNALAFLPVIAFLVMLAIIAL